MKVLRWKKAAGSEDDMPHELRVHENDHGGISISLVIRKRANQFLELHLPDGDIDTFVQAWDSQAKHNYWSQESQSTGKVDVAPPLATFPQNADYYFAIRFFPYKNRWIVWRVEHVEGYPNDTLSVFDGTRSDLLAFYAR